MCFVMCVLHDFEYVVCMYVCMYVCMCGFWVFFCPCSSLFSIDLNVLLMITARVVRLCCSVS